MTPQGLQEFRQTLIGLFGRVLEAHRVVPELVTDATGPGLLSIFGRRDERLLWDIVARSKEVWNSYEALSDIALYFRRTPYTSLGVTRTRYLTFLIGAYLHELYILNERIMALSGVIARKYKPLIDTTAREFAATAKQVSRQLAAPLQLRGRHVHEERLKDASLQELQDLEMVSEISPDPVSRQAFAHAFERRYRRARAEWKKTIQENNTVAGSLLDVLFTALGRVVFTDQADIRLPRHWPDA